MLYFFLTVLALSAAAIANIKIRYDAKTPQFAIFGTRVICVFYSSIFTVCKEDVILDIFPIECTHQILLAGNCLSAVYMTLNSKI